MPDPKSAHNDQYHWRFRSYEFQTADFSSAMDELYRGELERSNTWRERLDNTTNWAVMVTALLIGLAFSGLNVNHLVIILGTLFITFFLFVEARRYQYYELWSFRVRLMETDFFAAMLVPPFAPSQDWAERLAHSLLQPEFPITRWEAIGRRFRRNYIWLYAILGAVWFLNLAIYPTTATSFSELLGRAQIGPLPGWFVLLMGLLFNGVMFAFGLLTAGMQQASGEVLPRYADLPVIGSVLASIGHTVEQEQTDDDTTPETTDKTLNQPSKRVQQRQQLLALIVCNRPKPLSKRIMDDMSRGVTALHGKGMFTETEREVLMVVLTVTEVAQLKSILREEDPNALMILAPAKEVRGRGFQALNAKTDN
jgi:uncharacterized membrane protein